MKKCRKNARGRGTQKKPITVRRREKDEWNVQVRIETNARLLFIFDFQYKIPNIKYTFIEESLKHKIGKNGFYIPKLEDELIYRLAEYDRFRNKIKHLNYVKEHIQHLDKQKLIDNMENGENICHIL